MKTGETIVKTPKTYRVTAFVRVSNAIVGVLLRAGLPLGPNYLLTVRGRRSGVEHTIPVALVEHDGHRYLQSPFGNVNWIRNVRAAGGGTLRRGRHSERFTVTELSPVQAAPILKIIVNMAPKYVRDFLSVTRESSLRGLHQRVAQPPGVRDLRGRSVGAGAA